MSLKANRPALKVRQAEVANEQLLVVEVAEDPCSLVRAGRGRGRSTSSAAAVGAASSGTGSIAVLATAATTPSCSNGVVAATIARSSTTAASSGPGPQASFAPPQGPGRRLPRRHWRPQSRTGRQAARPPFRRGQERRRVPRTGSSASCAIRRRPERAVFLDRPPMPVPERPPRERPRLRRKGSPPTAQSPQAAFRPPAGPRQIPRRGCRPSRRPPNRLVRVFSPRPGRRRCRERIRDPRRHPSPPAPTPLTRRGGVGWGQNLRRRSPGRRGSARSACASADRSSGGDLGAEPPESAASSTGAIPPPGLTLRRRWPAATMSRPSAAAAPWPGSRAGGSGLGPSSSSAAGDSEVVDLREVSCVSLSPAHRSLRSTRLFPRPVMRAGRRLFASAARLVFSVGREAVCAAVTHREQLRPRWPGEGPRGSLSARRILNRFCLLVIVDGRTI